MVVVALGVPSVPVTCWPKLGRLASSAMAMPAVWKGLRNINCVIVYSLGDNPNKLQCPKPAKWSQIELSSNSWLKIIRSEPI
jgi:hypothetical protein